MITLICPNCQTVYDVESLSNEEWRIHNPNKTIIVNAYGKQEPLNFQSANQLQSAEFPMCLKVECVTGPGGGYLTSGPITIPLL